MINVSKLFFSSFVKWIARYQQLNEFIVLENCHVLKNPKEGLTGWSQKDLDPGKSFLRFIFIMILNYVYIYICMWLCVHEFSACGARGHQMPWSWSHRQLWVTWCGTRNWTTSSDIQLPLPPSAGITGMLLTTPLKNPSFSLTARYISTDVLFLMGSKTTG